MTSEELQKTIEFIVEQDAKSSVKIDALAEAQLRNEEGIRSMLAIAQMHEQEISTMSQLIGSVSRDVGILGETTRATDERLNTLINVVEQLIRNGAMIRSETF